MAKETEKQTSSATPKVTEKEIAKVVEKHSAVD